MCRGGVESVLLPLKVVVRKRPIHRAELKSLEFDVCTAANAHMVAVHDARMHSDMRHLLMHHHEFVFDQVSQYGQPGRALGVQRRWFRVSLFKKNARHGHNCTI